MQQGFVIPGGTAPEQLELAVLAERAGWDGVFVWEGGYVRRALRCDGVMTQSGPEEAADLLRWLDDNGGRPSPFDVVAEGETQPGDASPLAPWQGIATWWLESRWMAERADEVRRRIEAGPVPSPA